ncbi:MAG: GFA family protein [Burkholderiales bacterium]|nr:GFA family protein [Burkholderiales bacterium]
MRAPRAFDCHCRMCPRAFGNVSAAFFDVAAADLAWARGAQELLRSSALAQRRLCGERGTPLTFRYDGAARIDRSVASLDDARVMRPAFRLCVESRRPAFSAPDGLPAHAIEESPDCPRSLAGAGGAAPRAR